MRIEWDKEREQWDTSLAEVRDKIAEFETDKSNAIIQDKMTKMKEMLEKLKNENEKETPK